MKILITLLIIIPASIFGQRDPVIIPKLNADRPMPCVYMKDEVDEFTKDKILLTFIEKVSYPEFGQPELMMALLKYNDLFQIVINIEKQKELFCLDGKSTLMLLNDEGNVTTLTHYETWKCSELSAGGTYHEGVFHFSVSKDELLSLSKQKINKVRITSTDRNIEFSFIGPDINKQRGVDYFKKRVTCVMR